MRSASSLCAQGAVCSPFPSKLQANVSPKRWSYARKRSTKRKHASGTSPSSVAAGAFGRNSYPMYPTSPPAKSKAAGLCTGTPGSSDASISKNASAPSTLRSPKGAPGPAQRATLPARWKAMVKECGPKHGAPAAKLYLENPGIVREDSNKTRGCARCAKASKMPSSPSQQQPAGNLLAENVNATADGAGAGDGALAGVEIASRPSQWSRFQGVSATPPPTPPPMEQAAKRPMTSIPRRRQRRCRSCGWTL
mmetsp:Transcript_104779/g.337820  ORF Transcript_104779/g.337820 Transcript_104779/m.337820 type:complete len:251 (-) Transcript_104779:173-925(-)